MKLALAILTLTAGLALGGLPTRPPHLAGCPLFPADNVWNRRVDRLPVAASSAATIRSIGLDTGLHPDFGSGLWKGKPIGIPYTVVGARQPKVRVRFVEFGDESDHVRYPIRRGVKIEPWSDRHALILQRGTCRLFELYHLRRTGRGWEAGTGATWNLRSNRLRPTGWTSADAAGLPILPGLARYEEVAAGRIDHALRFTVERTQRAYVYPARHYTSDLTDRRLPPMGLRLRLRAGFDTSGFPSQARVILEALKRYGMIVTDNGASWYISGVPDPRWLDDDLHTLRRVTGSSLEVVDTSTLRSG